MRASHRKLTLFALLTGVVALVFLDPTSEEPSAAAPSAGMSQESGPGNADSTSESKRSPGLLALALPERPALGEPRAALFGSESWQPPTPKVSVAPVAPSAPPMPYRFAGRLIKDGQLQVFLAKGDIAIPVSQGEVLDSTYRIESIEAENITLVYLPLGKKQSIPTTAPLRSAAIEALGVTEATRAPQPGLGSIPASTVIRPATTSLAPAASREKMGSRIAGLNPEKPAARLAWAGPDQVKVGANFSVALRVMTDQPLRTSPIQLRFDPAVLESVEVRPGKSYIAEGHGGFSYQVNPAGSIVVGASNTGTSAASDREIVVLTFRPIKPGAIAEVSVASLNLHGPAGNEVTTGALSVFRAPVAP